MSEFIIHQHHHYGWTTTTHEADSLDAAIVADVIKYHGFLDEYKGQYSIIYDSAEQRYAVRWTGDEPKTDHFGPPLYSGDSWFGDQIRPGEQDDCPKCGGTGRNHYYSWKQCWACGDKNKDGPSCGKRSNP